jgi:hypothetical protein
VTPDGSAPTWRTNSDALHVTERFRRIDFGHLDDTVTIDDPKAYEKPWTNKSVAPQADTETSTVL